MTKFHQNQAKSKLANLLGVRARDIAVAHSRISADGRFCNVRLLAGKRDWNGNGGIAITCRLLANGGWAGSETWHDNFAEVAASDVKLRHAAAKTLYAA